VTRPDYSTHDPKGWCGDPKRGAAMGRHRYLPEKPESWTGKLYVSEVRIDGGGYDRNGTYFGHAGPLYWCADASGEVDFTVRASDRAAALVEIRKTLPLAKFARS